MLAIIRRFTKTWPARLLFVVLVAAFGLWGVAGKLNDMGGDTAVAHVGGTRIEPAEVQRVYGQQMAQLAKQNGPDYQPPPALRRQVADQAVQQLVVQTVAANALKRMGLVVPDGAIRDETFGLAAFKGSAGTFDRQTFLSVLARNNFDETSFIKLVRDDLGRRELLGAVQAGAAAPAVLVNQLFAFLHETRVAAVVNLPLAAAAAVPAPTDAQLQRFWANNPALYATPEYRRVKVVVLSPQTMAADMPISETDMQAYYKAAETTYIKPERRSVQVLSVPDQARAVSLAAAWTRDADWDAEQAAAKAAGATPIELTDAKRGELPDAALAAAAFSAAPNAVSAPIKGDFGWYVVKVTSVTPAVTTTLAQARDDIRRRIGVLKANEAIDDRANKVEDALAGGGGLDNLPPSLGLAAVEGTMDAQGHTADGTPAPLPAFPALRTAIIAEAFKSRPGEAPHLAQVPASKDNPGGGYYALSVESITPPARLGFEQAAAKARLDWTRDQMRHAQEVRAAALLSAVNAGTPIALAALKVGLAAQTLPPIQRPPAPAPAGVPQALLGPLFGMKQGDATMVATDDGFSVAQLQAINITHAGSDPIGADQLRSSLNKSLAGDITDQFVLALQQREKITVNTRMLQQIAQP